MGWRGNLRNGGVVGTGDAVSQHDPPGEGERHHCHFATRRHQALIAGAVPPNAASAASSAVPRKAAQPCSKMIVSASGRIQLGQMQEALDTSWPLVGANQCTPAWCHSHSFLHSFMPSFLHSFLHSFIRSCSTREPMHTRRVH